ncbi:MAG: sodium:proton exchanger [Candidatus Magasanikbacteria bacterium CG11_big_fil_rev_8_21_14_0_20_39_34]|uniref:Sodium:proton exchanger n=1 Tax=Candidatus Magasanikbacteria bacterium CG11_big_fil_rev_8_21_14_0_20_39_34 TaxID=1974653 RepID=A0A2H0N6G3_9BACT|nr:MAG: sodium:proton exchanger [Candidatus Magasanikbacteria bacterium CG11_big_fil_rev_8_21_14_0_20_39_34]
MFLPILLLVVGIAVLILGAEALVRGASSAAKKWGISTIVIGLTVVSFGTSAPELFVNLISAYKGSTDLAIANVVGSNLANILLILGIGAVIIPLKVKEGTTFREIPFAFLAILLVVILGNDMFLDGAYSTVNVLSRSDGIAFVAFFIIFLFYTYGLTKIQGEHEHIDTYSWTTSVVMFLAGLLALAFGGKLIVDNAIILAHLAGMSEALIGLTIVALGTSLPELATTIVAVRKGHTDLAIGNAVGSNIFNVFWILGLTAVIKPLEFDTQANIDTFYTVFATFLLFLFMFVGDKHKLSRLQGILFIVLYIAYIGYAVVR